MDYLYCGNIAAGNCRFSGERDLFLSPVFRRWHLSLLCGVPLEALEEESRNRAGLPERGLLDYLICREDRPIMALALGEESPDPPAGILSLRLPHTSSADILDKTQTALWKFFQNGPPASAPGPRVHLRTVPQNRLEDLAEAHLARCTFGRGWFPTEYGKSLGLVRRWSAMEGLLSPDLVCAPEAWPAHIRPRLAPRREEDCAGFARKIDRLDRGLSADPAYGRAIAARFADMPLEDYLRDCPEALDQLRRELGPAPRTYREAAVAINSLLLQRNKTKGRELMLLLAEPLLAESENKQKGR